VAQLDAMRGQGPDAQGQSSGMLSSGLRGGSDFDYYGIPKSDESKGIDYAQLYNATFNEAKESLLRSRTPGGRAGPAEATAAQTQGRSELRSEPIQPRDPVRASFLTAPASGAAHPAAHCGGSRLRAEPREAAGGPVPGQSRGAADRADPSTLSWVKDNPYVNTGTWNPAPS
jgi:hypothetical protein